MNESTVTADVRDRARAACCGPPAPCARAWRSTGWRGKLRGGDPHAVAARRFAGGPASLRRSPPAPRAAIAAARRAGSARGRAACDARHRRGRRAARRLSVLPSRSRQITSGCRRFGIGGTRSVHRVELPRPPIATRGGPGRDGSQRRRAGVPIRAALARGIRGHDDPHGQDHLVCPAAAVPVRRRVRLAVPVRAAALLVPAAHLDGLHLLRRAGPAGGELPDDLRRARPPRRLLRARRRARDRARA